MKIAISYPPIESDKGTPLLSQNRQFQWFSNPTYIYPIVLAQAATLLKIKGYDVIWDDGIAERKSYSKWLNNLIDFKPDLVMMETKTPVIKKHWKIINDLKTKLPNLMVVLVGDHVTALPKESMENCKVDYILCGGDYDFLILNLVNHLTKKEKLEAGIWYRKNKEIKNTGHFQLDHNLNFLPHIDRDLTRWKLYAYKNGNYKKTPGTYIMTGRDCWWGKCRFCSWTTLYPNFRTRTPENVLDEIGILINKYNVREIMDDTGTFPAGKWLEDFCKGMIERGYNKKVIFDCNMRAGILNQKQYNLMGEAGFRFLLYGLESANQKTLDKINKGTREQDIVRDLEMAKKAGLEPHITVMIGYPWETKEEAQRTLNLAKMLFSKNWVDSLQATIVIPYPGTPLFSECDKQNLLLTKDWDRYDMKEPIMKSTISDKEIKSLTQNLYKSFLAPKFIFKKLISIRSSSDVKFIFRAGISVLGHLLDFKNRKKVSKECE